MAIRNPRPLAPLLKADSPYQGEMSRRDKRDRARWHGRSTRKGHAASVRQQSCQRLRSDVGIRIPVQQPPLSKGGGTASAVTEGFRPPESYPKNGIPQSASLTASPIPFVPSGHFPLTRGIGLAMTGFFDSLKRPKAAVRHLLTDGGLSFIMEKQFYSYVW